MSFMAQNYKKIGIYAKKNIKKFAYINQKKAVILQSHLRKVVLYRGVEQW